MKRGAVEKEEIRKQNKKTERKSRVVVVGNKNKKFFRGWMAEEKLRTGLARQGKSAFPPKGTSA